MAKNSMDCKRFLQLIAEGNVETASLTISNKTFKKRKEFFGILTDAIFCNNKYIGQLPKFFNVSKDCHADLFNSILFFLLIPIYHRLVKSQRWNEALEFENSLYSFFIKQDEDEKFYDRVFGELYQPFQKFQIQSKQSNLKSEINSVPTCRNRMLFWFPNLNHLAHVDVFLNFLQGLGDCRDIFVSSLEKSGDDSVRTSILRSGASLIASDDSLGISERYRRILEICATHQVKTIVFVSLPLHSGFLKAISKDVEIVWWSMKFPLGSVKHFDRLVCYRSLIPEVRLFNDTHWLCSPFSVHGVKKTSLDFSNAPLTPSEIRLGVLSREEKFASSELPELLNDVLQQTKNTRLFWTGRRESTALAERLSKDLTGNEIKRSEFVGWANPEIFLNSIDILIDTPNLGGLVAYWAMSIDKMVISATANGSIGALGSPQLLDKYFECLRDKNSITVYFSNSPVRPFYLSDQELIPHCLFEIEKNLTLIEPVGKLFGDFFRQNLSNFEASSKVTFSFLAGISHLDSDQELTL